MDFPSSGDWFVLHTRSRQEKVVSDELEARGVGVFLPLITAPRYYGRRKAIVRLPLFPCYLFMRGTAEQAWLSERAKRLAGIIPVHDQALLDWELRNLHMALQANAALTPYPMLKRGTRVEVRCGPLRGLQGLVEDVKHDGRLVLQVRTLGQAVSLDIHGAIVDPVCDSMGMIA